MNIERVVETDLGKVAMTPKGAWDVTLDYAILDVVAYHGSSYVALQPIPAGTAITNATYWQKLAERGGESNIDDSAGIGDYTAVWSADFLKKHETYVTPQMFGAKGDGITDDTLSIINAINNGKNVYFPAGVYKISDVININENNIKLYGDYGGTRIVQVSQNNCFEINGKLKVHISNMRIEKSNEVANQSNDIEDIAIIINNNSQDCIFENLWIANFEVGLYLNNGANCFFNNINIRNFSKYAIYSDTFVDAYFSNIYIQAYEANTHTAIGVELRNKNEAIVFNTGEILRCKHPLVMDSDSPYSDNYRQSPFECLFTNIYFDSYSDTIIINRSKRSKFTNCYFHNGWTNGNNGIEITVSHYITFTSCSIVGCGLNGCTIDSNSKGIKFESCLIANNNYQETQEDTCGILISGASFVSVNNTIFSNSLGNEGEQKYGLIVGGDTSKLSINECVFENQTIKELNNYSSRDIVSISNCIGLDNFNNSLTSHIYKNAESIELYMESYDINVGNSAFIVNGNTKTFAIININNSPTITPVFGNVTYTISFDSNSKILLITPSERLWGKTIISYM